MTPLKTPIVAKFDTAELAIATIAHNAKHRGEEVTPSMLKCKEVRCAESLYAILDDMKEQLKAQGIDYRTWEPPQPLTIGGRAVEPQLDGSIRFGGTTIARATLLKVLALSDEMVKKGAVSEWPKFMRHPKDREGVLEFRQNHRESIWHYANGSKAEINIYCDTDEAKAKGWYPITPAEAAEILKTTNK